MFGHMFVNLPVKNLQASMQFFTRLGLRFNPQFTDDTAACLILGENLFAMLVTEAKFREFTPKAIADATKSSEVLVGLSCDSRQKVDDIVMKAVAAGGLTYNQPQDLGFMYSHGFQDLDGHIWDIFWMAPENVKPLPVT